MHEVDSSVISMIHYDETAAELHITFASGRIYVYYAVPRKVFEHFLLAPSKGVFFNAHIRNHYRYRRSG